MFRTVRAALRTMIFGSVIVLDTAVIGSVAGLLGLVNPASRWVDRVARLWARVFALGAGARIRVEGRETIDPTRSYVFVSNHDSNLDIPVNFLAVAPVGIRFLAKKELFKVPVLGPIMRSIGIIRTDRQAGRIAHDGINVQIQHIVERGLSLMIYPEGTRSRDGTLHPFKRGAFRIAIDNQMDVVPISIAGTYQAWPPESRLVYGGKVLARVHAPISVAGLDHDDIGDVLRQTYDVIAAGTAELERELAHR